MRLRDATLALQLAVAGAALAGAAAAGVADSPTARAPTSDDHVLARAYLPSPDRVHGELRLVRRGDSLCMQTLVYSDSLRRGVDRIRKKELYHWPAGRPGADQSARYLEGLDQAKRHVLERFAVRDGLADPRPRMLIEFVLGQRSAQVAFYDVDVARQADGFSVRDRQPILTLESTRDYVGRAIRIQGEEGFATAAPELAALPR